VVNSTDEAFIRAVPSDWRMNEAPPLGRDATRPDRHDRLCSTEAPG
jgi:hypothetical protein